MESVTFSEIYELLFFAGGLYGLLCCNWAIEAAVSHCAWL
jgi:hypothetical protein